MELFCQLDRQETSIVLALRPSQTLIKVFHMADSWLLFLVYDSQNGCTSLIKKDLLHCIVTRTEWFRQ